VGHQLGDLPGEVRKQRMISSKPEGLERLTINSPNMLLSGSRDKTLIIWNLTREEGSYGYPKRSLHGHSHIVSDCVRVSPLMSSGTD
jgi:hypothetical protein